MSEVYKLLAEIQQKLKAPKGQRNNFGNYNYRSCEDILSAVKPYLGEAVLIINDEIVEVGGRVYVKATVTLSLNGESIQTTALAREADQRKGMNADQLTGATSSYARKYACNGMFAIDDTKDSDTTDHRQQTAKTTAKSTINAKAEYDKYFAIPEGAKRDAYWNKLSHVLQTAIHSYNGQSK